MIRHLPRSRAARQIGSMHRRRLVAQGPSPTSVWLALLLSFGCSEAAPSDPASTDQPAAGSASGGQAGSASGGSATTPTAGAAGAGTLGGTGSAGSAGNAGAGTTPGGTS